MVSNKKRPGGRDLVITKEFVDFLYNQKEAENLSGPQFEKKYDLADSTLSDWKRKFSETVSCTVKSEVLFKVCRNLLKHLGKRPEDFHFPKKTCQTLEGLGLYTQFGEPIEEAHSKEARPGADADVPERLRNCIRSFDDFIDQRTQGFVGREFVFNAIKRFLERSDVPSGYFIIEGDPGIGKSAILAEYVNRKKCVAHFNIRSEAVDRTEQFLENVCARLIVNSMLPYTELPPDAKHDPEVFKRILKEACARLKAGDRIVIAIDALDEVNVSSQSPTANILYLPESPPHGVYFIMTTRPRRKYSLRLVTQAHVEPYDLMDFPGESRRDIVLYTSSFAERPRLRAWIDSQKLTVRAFIDALAEKSENNFMYLRYVLPAIEHGEYSDLRIDDLPSGLEAYYEDHWRRMGMTATPLPRTKIKIVYVLTELGEPVSRRLLSEVTKEDEVTVQEVIDEWREFLHEHAVGGQSRYSVYHGSFRDFLYKKEIVQAAGVTIEEINGLIKDDLLKGLYGDG
jgi:hypothetical protein